MRVCGEKVLGSELGSGSGKAERLAQSPRAQQQQQQTTRNKKMKKLILIAGVLAIGGALLSALTSSRSRLRALTLLGPTSGSSLARRRRPSLRPARRRLPVRALRSRSRVGPCTATLSAVISRLLRPPSSSGRPSRTRRSLAAA